MGRNLGVFTMTDEDIEEFESWCESMNGRFRKTTESRTRRPKWECRVDGDLASVIDTDPGGPKKRVELTQGNRNSRDGIHVGTMGVTIDRGGSIKSYGPGMIVKTDYSHQGIRFE